MNTGAGECAVALLLMGHNTCIWTLTTKLWIPSLQFSSGEMGNLPFKHSLSASKWTLNITVTWTFWQSEQVALAELLSFRKHFHTSEAQWELTAELLTEVVVVAAMVGLRVLLCLLTVITWDMHKQEQPWPILAMWPPHTYEASVNNEAECLSHHYFRYTNAMIVSVQNILLSGHTHMSIHTSYIHGLYVIHTQHHKPLQIPLKAIDLKLCQTDDLHFAATAASPTYPPSLLQGTSSCLRWTELCTIL